MKFPRIAFAAAALASAGAANAATVVYQSDVVDWTSTDFSTLVGLKQFDATLGTLTSVKVTLFGTVRAEVQAENMSTSSASTTDLTLNGKLTLSRPDGSPIVINAPFATVNFDLDPFDGTFDYKGASGTSFVLTGQEISNAAALTALEDLALFIGNGQIPAGLDVVATASSVGSGGVTVFPLISATGYATVEYAYDEVPSAVPEPATWALMVIGIGMVGASVRHRRTGAVAA